jgi:arginase
MLVDLILVPYDTGLAGDRMGRGPSRLLEAGLVAALEQDGHRVTATALTTRSPFRVEAAVAVDLADQVAEAVRAARQRGALPLVLSGNCNAGVGTATALGTGQGIVWFDAHGDFNTPETSPSGYFDGMALAMATGRCWRTLVQRIGGFVPVPDDRVVLVGARDVDPGERELLAASAVTWVDAARLRQGDLLALDAALDALAARTSRVYLHLDLDVHDPQDAPANSYGAPGGPSRAQVLEAVAHVAARLQIAAAGLAAYDPAVDPDGRTAAAGVALARAIARAARP